MVKISRPTTMTRLAPGSPQPAATSAERIRSRGCLIRMPRAPGCEHCHEKGAHSRLPESYQDTTLETGAAGGDGGFQPGGGSHCSRAGSFGHGPRMRCGALPPPTAGHFLRASAVGLDAGVLWPLKEATN